MKALYPGSFDPVHLGHIDIIERAARVFEELVVAVSVNRDKEPLFSVEERVELLRVACGHLGNVTVDYFSGLTVDYAVKQGAGVVVRGLRAVSDFEFELQMAATNKRINDSIETMFIMTSPEYSFLGSRIVKEIAVLGAPVGELVPKCVEDMLMRKLAECGR